MEVKMMRLMRQQETRTMKETALKLGIGESYYCLIEQGRRKPSAKLRKKMEKHFGATYEKLMGEVSIEVPAMG